MAADERPLLTHAQEIALAKRVERGDLAAKTEFMEKNMRLVVWVAQKYRGNGLDLTELVSEGTIGLVRAVELWNWRRGVRFSSYATHWIRQAIRAAISNLSRTIRVPAHLSA